MYLLIIAQFSKPTDSPLMHSHFILINIHNSDYDICRTEYARTSSVKQLQRVFIFVPISLHSPHIKRDRENKEPPKQRTTKSTTDIFSVYDHFKIFHNDLKKIITQILCIIFCKLF